MFSRHFIPRHLLLCVGALITICAHAAHAQNSMIVNFNENGVGTVQFPGALPFTLQSLGNINDPLDPSSPIKPLAYNLVGAAGASPVDGDVLISEIDPLTGVQALSDVVRFEHGILYVYSDVPTAGEVSAIADVGFPTLFQANKLAVLETGPEVGPNGMFGYVPSNSAPPQPGALSAPVTYNFLSDPTSTPEPGTLMALLPAGAMFLIRRRRKLV